MNVLLYGGTGMVGQGVLRECLRDPEVKVIQTVGRRATGVGDSKVREVVKQDLLHYASEEAQWSGFDACFFCLGVTSAGMKQAVYQHLTYDLTMAAAEMLAPLNPQMTFIYVSGMGTDTSEQGRLMWARVKGKTENALLRLPFKAAYMFRPGFIQPLHGIRSKTRLYQTFYSVTGPLLPVLRAILPGFVLTTEEIGRAMLAVARRGFPRHVLESRDIRAAAA